VRPACPSRASGWSSLITQWGFPCCVRFPCVHAAATTPVQRLGVFLAHLTPPCQPSPEGSPGRPAHRPFRGLLDVYSRCGLHTRAVTNSWPANRRLQPFRYLHDCSDCFRLERIAGWASHPLESAALSRRTPFADVCNGICASPNTLRSAYSATVRNSRFLLIRSKVVKGAKDLLQDDGGAVPPRWAQRV